MKKHSICLALLLPISLPSVANTSFTDETAFLNAINPSYYLEDFSTYVYGDPMLNPTEAFGTINGYSWTASASQGLFANNSALSTNDALEPITITFTGLPVYAIGGIFGSTNFSGGIIQQLINVSLSNGQSNSLTGSGFLGFTSDIPISSLVIDGSDSPSSNWPQLDHFYVGTASVPEPASLALMGLGFAGMGYLQRRRKSLQA